MTGLTLKVLLLDENDTEIVIDINPYGSMPSYSSHPEPSLQLAKLLSGITKSNITA